MHVCIIYALMCITVHVHVCGAGHRLIKFCGRRLKVNPAFKLYLATALPPPSLPPALLSATSSSSFSVTLPTANGMLLQLCCDRLGVSGGYLGLSARTVEQRRALRDREARLFSLLEQKSSDGSYWWSTDTIADCVVARAMVAHDCTCTCMCSMT